MSGEFLDELQEGFFLPGFDEVVGGAEVEGAAAVLFAGAGRDHDHGKVVEFVAVAEGGKRGVAVEPGCIFCIQLKPTLKMIAAEVAIGQRGAICANLGE